MSQGPEPVCVLETSPYSASKAWAISLLAGAPRPSQVGSFFRKGVQAGWRGWQRSTGDSEREGSPLGPRSLAGPGALALLREGTARDPLLWLLPPVEG